MAAVLDLVSWVFIVIGSVMLVIGAIGVVRLPDVFARMHGLGIIDTMGTGAVMAGLMIQAGLGIVTIKLMLIVVFILFTSPTPTHALSRAALNGGVRPALDTADAADDDGADTGAEGDAGDGAPRFEGEAPSKT